MQIKKLAEVLLPKQRHPRIRVFPVQVHDIQSLLRRAAAAERSRTRPDHKMRASHH
jgi:hypothetical protein